MGHYKLVLKARIFFYLWGPAIYCHFLSSCIAACWLPITALLHCCLLIANCCIPALLPAVAHCCIAALLFIVHWFLQLHILPSTEARPCTYVKLALHAHRRRIQSKRHIIRETPKGLGQDLMLQPTSSAHLPHSFIYIWLIAVVSVCHLFPDLVGACVVTLSQL